MPEERKRVPVEESYLTGLGEVLYCFACLEWNATWCLEKLKSGFIASRDADKITAGDLANRLVTAAENVDHKEAYRAALLIRARDFRELVKKRNRIFHGTPGSDENMAQRMGSQGHFFTPDFLAQTADEFTICSMALRELMDRL